MEPEISHGLARCEVLKTKVYHDSLRCYAEWGVS